MQFQAKNPISELMSQALVRWMQALDGSSETLVDAESGQLHISSRLSEPQIIEVLRNLGFDAVPTEQSDSGHEKGGSTCCGGCS